MDIPIIAVVIFGFLVGFSLDWLLRGPETKRRARRSRQGRKAKS
jgi:hypothetical protein